MPVSPWNLAAASRCRRNWPRPWGRPPARPGRSRPRCRACPPSPMPHVPWRSSLSRRFFTLPLLLLEFEVRISPCDRDRKWLRSINLRRNAAYSRCARPQRQRPTARRPVSLGATQSPGPSAVTRAVALPERRPGLEVVHQESAAAKAAARWPRPSPPRRCSGPGAIAPKRWMTRQPCSGQRASASAATRPISASAMPG